MSEFTCESCHRTFERGRPDDEATTESKTLWGDLPKEELAVVCDDCFRALRAARGGWPDEVPRQ